MAEILEAAPLGERDRERLQGVVAQHQRRDVVGHGGEQAVPPRQIELAGAHGAAEGDLDVDLDVGGVHPGGVVDRVGIAASAGEAELDPRPRRHGEIGALADDARAELRRRNPDGIVGAVADLAVALLAAAHEGADAAEEEEVGPDFEDRLDDLRRGGRVRRQVEERPRLAAEADRFFLAREDAAAF